MFECEVCGKFFASSWNLKRHAQSAHVQSASGQSAHKSDEHTSEHDHESIDGSEHEESEIPSMISSLVEQSQEFYKKAASNRQKLYERDGLTSDQAEIEVCMLHMIQLVLGVRKHNCRLGVQRLCPKDAHNVKTEAG